MIKVYPTHRIDTAEAKKLGIPTHSLLNELNGFNALLRLGQLKEVAEQREVTVRKINRHKLFRFPLALINLIIGLAVFVAYHYVLAYGWNHLVAPVFGLATVTTIQTIAIRLVGSYLIKGAITRKTMEEIEAEREKNKNVLWLESLGKALRINLLNGVVAFVFYWVFYLFT